MKVAKFEKISLIDSVRPFYDNIILPKRATVGSAGYDFYLPYDLDIKAGESAVITTGVRCKIKKGYVLLIFPRSSLGTKYKLSLDNTVGVIDSDYYHATNEGHIIIQVTNHSDETLSLKSGERFVQGILIKFGLTMDDNTKNKRTGGLGSTGKKWRRSRLHFLYSNVSYKNITKETKKYYIILINWRYY